MEKDRRPTIVDVAKEAGVSRSLVSLVLQNPEKVSEHRKAAVHVAMQKLGYRPNRAARSLIQQRSDTIGVLVSDLRNPFYTEVLDGIEAKAREHDLRVLLADGGRDRDREKTVAETFIELRTDGIIAIAPRLSTNDLSEIARVTATVVVARPGRRPTRTSSVHTDDDVGIELAIDHLWQLGHRRIAHVSGGTSPGARAREAAYLRAMAKRDATDVRVVQAEPDESGGYQAGLTLLDTSARPTAIVASNDYAALGLLHAASVAGLECPRDISIVGYDNSALAQLGPISLTTVNQPRLQMGETAWLMLAELIARADARTAALTPTLVVRRTTAPPR